MKRIFNKSNSHQPPAQYQVPEELYNPPPSLKPGGGSNRLSKQDDYLRTSAQADSPSSSLKRNVGGGGTNRGVYSAHEQGVMASAPKQSSRRPKSGTGGTHAYPSYGEVQLDSAENRGGGFMDRSVAEPIEAVYHQKLPPRSSIPQSLNRNHSRSQSAVPNPYLGSQRLNYFQGSADSKLVTPLPNPYSNTRGNGMGKGPERQASVSRGQTGSRPPTKGVARRASQTQGVPYQDDQPDRPSRRPSLLYGIDSSVHGGYASVAMANAAEQENQADSNYEQQRDENVIRPGTRYVDRYIDVRTPQSVAIGAGMDKVKRKFFGRKKKDERVESDEKEQDSSEEWARVEHPIALNSQEAMMKSEVEQRSEQGNVQHAPWFGGRKHLNKSTESAITSQIGILCINDEESWDWNHILALCNSISHSEAASKEAARALRREFKYGEEEPKFHAVRLWAIICTRASDRFRLQVANKKFLEVLEDLYTDKKTSTRLRGRLLLVWSMLAYEYQLDQDLHPISRMFNKVKPNEMPINGIALDPSNELFNPSSSISKQQQYQGFPVPYSQDMHHTQLTEKTATRSERQVHQYDQKFLQAESPVARPSSQRSTFDTSASEAEDPLPRISDDIRRLHQECVVARSNAQVMTEALLEHGLESDLVIEFAAKTQQSQDFIVAQIPWASAQADRSRAERQDQSVREEAGFDVRQSTKEENLMEDLLETHEKLVSANSMITEARERQREEEEERQVIDQSMREQRIDRSTLFQESTTGQLYSIQGGGLAPPMETGQSSSSRSASPTPPVIRRPLPVPGLTDPSMLLNNSGGFTMQKSLSTPSQLPLPPTGDAPIDDSWSNGPAEPLKASKSISTYRGGPRPMNESPSLSAAGTDFTGNDNHQKREENEDDDDSIVMTPTAPSAKALGKRRAMSTHDSLSNDVNEVADQMTNNMSLQSNTLNEDNLRARPPPALPIPPSDQLYSS